MAGPVSAGESRVGRVKAAHLEAQGGSVAEKDPVADRAMDGVVGEAIGRRLLEVEPGVAAEAGDPARERCSQDGECSHGPASPYRAGPTVITRAPVRNPGGRSLVTWVTRLLAPVLAAHEPDGPGEVVGERRQFGRAVRQALDGAQLLRGGGGDCFGFLTGGVGAPFGLLQRLADPACSLAGAARQIRHPLTGACRAARRLRDSGEVGYPVG